MMNTSDMDETIEPRQRVLRIRLATADDLEILTEGNRALAAETEGKTLDSATLSAGVRRLLSKPSAGRYFVAELLQSQGDLPAGAVVGQAMHTREWSDWRNGEWWWLQSVYVWPAMRRRGVFRALYEHLRTEARSTPDVVGLRLYVEQGNAAAQATYQSLGMASARYLVLEEEWSPHRDAAPILPNLLEQQQQ